MQHHLKLFTNYLHCQWLKKPLCFDLHRFSLQNSSLCGTFTNIVSSPIHSILHQGIIHSSFFSKKEQFPPLTIIDSIFPSSRSISKSQGYPNLSPPHRFITSLSRRSAVLILCISTSKIRLPQNDSPIINIIYAWNHDLFPAFSINFTASKAIT